MEPTNGEPRRAAVRQRVPDPLRRQERQDSGDRQAGDRRAPVLEGQAVGDIVYYGDGNDTKVVEALTKRLGPAERHQSHEAELAGREGHDVRRDGAPLVQPHRQRAVERGAGLVLRAAREDEGAAAAGADARRAGGTSSGSAGRDSAGRDSRGEVVRLPPRRQSIKVRSRRPPVDLRRALARDRAGARAPSPRPLFASLAGERQAGEDVAQGRVEEPEGADHLHARGRAVDIVAQLMFVPDTVATPPAGMVFAAVLLASTRTPLELCVVSPPQSGG